MATAKKLSELISQYGNLKVVDEQNRSFIHMVNVGDKLVLSVYKPIGHCKVCGEYVYPDELLTEYEGVCTNCDENKYSFEIAPLSPDKDTECL